MSVVKLIWVLTVFHFNPLPHESFWHPALLVINFLPTVRNLPPAIYHPFTWLFNSSMYMCIAISKLLIYTQIETTVSPRRVCFFFVHLWEFINHLICKQSSFLLLTISVLYNFCCLTAIARTSGMILNRSGKKTCLLPCLLNLESIQFLGLPF